MTSGSGGARSGCYIFTVTLRRLPSVSWIAMAVLSACAHTPPLVAAPAPVIVAPAPPPVPVVSGVYDWTLSTTDEHGDIYLEKEEWHLTQTGSALAGWYDRTVTVVSSDEQPYRCNRKLSFSKFTRVRFSGTVAGEKLEVREVGFEPGKPNPCDSGERMLVSYKGVARAATIELLWAPGAGQTLYRRESVSPALAVEGKPAQVVAAIEGAPASVAASMPIAGTYEWELRSVDADGDSRIEHERWELQETDEGIVGHYDRVVTRVRGGGALFVCNHEDRYDSNTRYTVHGQRVADRFKIVEVEYKAVPDRCDNGLRRMDAYDGLVVGEGDELLLSWGSGSQLLRRTK